MKNKLILNKHELDVYNVAKKVTTMLKDFNPIIGGSLALKLHGYELVHPVDDLDIVINIYNDPYYKEDYIIKEFNKGIIELLNAKEVENKKSSSLEEDDEYQIDDDKIKQEYYNQIIVDGINIHIILVIYNDDIFKVDFSWHEINGNNLFRINTIINILNAKLQYGFYGNNTKHLKQINLCLNNNNHNHLDINSYELIEVEKALLILHKNQEYNIEISKIITIIPCTTREFNKQNKIKFEAGVDSNFEGYMITCEGFPSKFIKEREFKENYAKYTDHKYIV